MMLFLAAYTEAGNHFKNILGWFSKKLPASYDCIMVNMPNQNRKKRRITHLKNNL